jgi:hypothetical protein
MEALLASAEEGRAMDIGSTCERPAPLPPGGETGQIDPKEAT